MDFQPVETNLRDSFRALAEGRPRADRIEYPGITIASLGVMFQMFNAAFFNAPVETLDALQIRVELARLHFARREMMWSFWVCEDWLARPIRRHLSKICHDSGLRLVSEHPGMTLEALRPSRPRPRDFQIEEVDSSARLAHFRTIGAECFRVPPAWFAEVFRDEVWQAGKFRSFVGYRNGVPVTTAALVFKDSTAGIYNVATLPAHRGRGYAEAATRHAILSAGPAEQVILQATTSGFRMYQRMGFRESTRILVYASDL